MATVTPYLHFGDTCEAAFDFYKSVFGGEYWEKMRFSDMPSGAPAPGSADESKKILHCSLPIGNGTVLMGSDVPRSMGTPQPGMNFSVSVSTDNDEEATRIFNALSAGGRIDMPLAVAPWGALFGGFVDKFGVSWLVTNTEHSSDSNSQTN